MYFLYDYNNNIIIIIWHMVALSPFLWPSARHQPKLQDHRHRISVLHLPMDGWTIEHALGCWQPSTLSNWIHIARPTAWKLRPAMLAESLEGCPRWILMDEVHRFPSQRGTIQPHCAESAIKFQTIFYSQRRMHGDGDGNTNALLLRTALGGVTKKVTQPTLTNRWRVLYAWVVY